jgi:outer membrane protein assembly factor BamB
MSKIAHNRVFCVLLILILAPLIPAAQTNDITIDRLWAQHTDSVIYGGAQVYETRLYAGGGDGLLRAVDKLTGKVDWTFNAGATVSGEIAAIRVNGINLPDENQP